jgi:glucosamine--fructose-6-phosphate aminotransferase (isomerizing)
LELLGVGKAEYFVASDMSAILPHTKNMIFLEDHMLATLSDSIEILSLKTGKKEKPNIQEINWQQESAHLGEFKHFMVKEIAEQPIVIEHLANECLPEIKKLSNVVKSAHGTFFIAAGTAYHACLSGIYLFSRIAKIHVNSAIASEFNYVEDFLKKKSLVMAFSQSGETIDVVEPLTRAQEKGATIAAVVNVIGSTIYRMASTTMVRLSSFRR